MEFGAEYGVDTCIITLKHYKELSKFKTKYKELIVKCEILEQALLTSQLKSSIIININHEL